MWGIKYGKSKKEKRRGKTSIKVLQKFLFFSLYFFISNTANLTNFLFNFFPPHLVEIGPVTSGEGVPAIPNQWLSKR